MVRVTASWTPLRRPRALGGTFGLTLGVSVAAALGACRPVADKGGAPDRADSGEPAGCVAPEAVDPALLPATFENAQGSRFRVLKVESEAFDSLGAVVFLPDEGASLWPEGAPVVVVAPPALNVNLRWGDNPTSYLDPSAGIIEVQPVFPGWTVQGVETTGPADGAGPRAALALAEVARFARGGRSTEKGWSITALLEGEACLDRLGVLSVSSGALALSGALLDSETLLEDAAVVGLYEPPSLPAFVTSEGGAIWMDPDEAADADGDGLAWDDGRNLSFDGLGCDAAACPSDLTSLAFTPHVSMSDLWPSDAEMTMPRGVFFLDRNGNGELDLGSGYHPDVNGDGRIGLDEDFFPKPVYDDFTDQDGLDFYYSPELLAEAEARLFPGGEGAAVWPAGFRTAAEADAFWGARAVGPRLAALSARWPVDRPIGVFYTEVPHGAALPDRPDSRIVYDALREGGLAVRYNADEAVSACVLGEAGLSGYAGAPEPGAAVTDLQPTAYPEAWSTEAVHTVSMVGLLSAAFGAPGACR